MPGPGEQTSDQDVKEIVDVVRGFEPNARRAFAAFIKRLTEIQDQTELRLTCNQAGVPHMWYLDGDVYRIADPIPAEGFRIVSGTLEELSAEHRALVQQRN